MGYTSLTLENVNDLFNKRYTYLIISKPIFDTSTKDKTLIKEQKQTMTNHHNTIAELKKDHCNLHNNPIDMNDSDIIKNCTCFDEFEDGISIYKIKPTSSKIVPEWHSSNQKYCIWEFDIINRITNQDGLIKQIAKDNLLQEFYQSYFMSKCYRDSRYRDDLIKFMNFIQGSYPNEIIYLSDIICQREYPYDLCCSSTDITRDNIRYAVDHGFVSLYKKGYTSVLINILRILIDIELFDIALKYVEMIPKDILDEIVNNIESANSNILDKYSLLKMALQKNTYNEEVKKLIRYLNVKLNQIYLSVIKVDDYGDEDTIEVSEFENIGQVKSYLIKKYDIPFEEALKDVENIYSRMDSDSEYRFKVN